MRRAQAVVIDGLFFLMICGFAAATLLWAGSIYGDKSFEAYRYIYMTDYTSGALAVLSQLDYKYTIAGSEPVKTAWLDELGKYMNGEFDETHNRYKFMIDQWQTLCYQSPAPLLMVVFTEYKGATRGGRAEPLYFDCEGEKNTDGRDEDRSLMDALKDDDGNVNMYKYPYYSSPIQSKSCATLRCVMDIKIYY